MNDQNNAEALHSQVVLLRMQGKPTEELLAIWQENDTSKWSKEDFDAVQKVLLERAVKLPEPKKRVNVNQDNKSSTASVSTDNLSSKYPYLTAYVGFVALFLLVGVVVSFIPRFGLLVQIVGGFYVFRFVIEKNVLPYVHRK